MDSKQYKYYYFHIQKLLKQIRNGCSINLMARNQVNSILIYIANCICEQSRRFVQHNTKKTLYESDIQKSLDVLCVQTESITSYKTKVWFPVSISKRFLKNKGYSKINISAPSSLYLSHCMQYICERILIKGIYYLEKSDHKRLHILDIYKGVDSDTFLKHLFTKLNIFFYIPKDIQRSIIPYTHVEMYVRKIVQPFSLKISKNVFYIIRCYVEQYIENILKKSYLISKNNNRVILLPKDIYCVLDILDIPIDLPNSNKIEFIDSDMDE